jgi:hypothetical protein
MNPDLRGELEVTSVHMTVEAGAMDAITQGKMGGVQDGG